MAILLSFILGSITLYAVPRFRKDIREYLSNVSRVLPEILFILFIGAIWLVIISAVVRWLRQKAFRRLFRGFLFRSPANCFILPSCRI